MIFPCPSCGTQFNIPPDKIGPSGRRVRCARCKHEWRIDVPLSTLSDTETETDTQTNHTAEPVAAVAAADVLASQMAEAGKAAHKGKQKSILAGVIVALFLALPFFVWRTQSLMATTQDTHQPTEAEKAMAETAKGITIDGTPTTRLIQEEGRNLLQIEGKLVNKADTMLRVPKLVAVGLNAEGKPVKEWNIPITTESLEAGQRYNFELKTPFAEQGVVDIAFHFR